MIEVVTVWAPRPNHPKWRNDYTSLLDLQRKTAVKWGHQHTVITDNCPASLPDSLMHAMIAGVIARLEQGSDHHLVFVDVDVLIAKPLEEAFRNAEKFDVGLTRRDNDITPINNGVMLVPAGSIQKALDFFRAAYARCGSHWGGDQEAISAQAAPVPPHEAIYNRDGVRISFLNMRIFSAVPKERFKKHRDAICVHFKGETKEWADDYARLFILTGTGD